MCRAVFRDKDSGYNLGRVVTKKPRRGVRAQVFIQFRRRRGGGMSNAVHAEFDFVSKVNDTIVSVNLRRKDDCEEMSSRTYNITPGGGFW